ncbi:MAG: T9SS type A sorting domain-containing protein [Chitinophagaceae bacterium]|nr:MAG: T9SS type A sorting domain-containing protein [Chitinophagaceae bacterium]
MNCKILLSSFLAVSSLTTQAQNSNKAFAITSDGNADHVWMNIRQVDLGTGLVTKTIFQRSKSNFVLTDLNSKRAVDQTTANPNIYMSKDYPTGSLVAAAAYDQRNNKLFFTPMRIGELRWVDLDVKNETPKFYTMTSDALSFGNSENMMDESNHITRMVIAADGNGYAITNDGNHFIKFTTGKKPVITELGALIDDEKNAGLSIHNKCSSWGGDMLADAFGKLYVISASKNVFVIDIDTRVATFKGTITGLPANFTSNAAAVNAEGKIVLGSANVFAGYYTASLEDLKATAVEGSDRQFNASDFANGNLLLQKEADAARKTGAILPMLDNAFSNSDKLVFPNPVTTSSFAVLFDGRKAGIYTIVLSDLSGRNLQSQFATINKGSQTVNVSLKSKPANGMYLVKVLDEGKQVVFTEKVMIQ